MNLRFNGLCSSFFRRLGKKMAKGKFIKKNAPEFCEVTIVHDGKKVVDNQQVKELVHSSLASSPSKPEIARQSEKNFFECVCFSGKFNWKLETDMLTWKWIWWYLQKVHFSEWFNRIKNTLHTDAHTGYTHYTQETWSHLCICGWMKYTYLHIWNMLAIKWWHQITAWATVETDNILWNTYNKSTTLVHKTRTQEFTWVLFFR